MAREFTSSTHSIDCGSAANLDDFSELTYAAWIRPTSVTVTRPFMQKGGGSGKRFRLNGAVRSGGVQFAVAHASVNADAQAATGTITVDEWQFIAGTLSSLVPRIYRGTPGGVVAEVSYAVQTTGVGGASPDASANLLLGGDGSNNFPGRCADFWVFDRALTAPQLTAIMYRTLPADIKGLWPCDGSNSPELDRSGLANNGTVTGATRANDPPIRPWSARLWGASAPQFETAGGGGGGAFPGYYRNYILSRRAA